MEAGESELCGWTPSFLHAKVFVMANPAPRPLTSGEKSEILAAIADLGERMDRRFEKVDRRFEISDERQRKQGEDIAELKGRMTGLEGQLRHLPTYFQVAGLNLALIAIVATIFGTALALLRYLGA